MENPVCAICKAENIITPSEVTDHIVPKDICKDPWDQTNWQALCKKHHAIKGAQDKKHFKPKR
jgi:5-methylcytosine-specific restriction protein A